jgi:hypothetical protein
MDPKNFKPPTGEARELLNDQLAMCFSVGVTPDEMNYHPEHGLMLSLSGVEKLVTLAPDQRLAKELVGTLHLHFGNTRGSA